MSLTAILADLPRYCDVGAKRNAKGHQETRVGYKLHIDTADGEIPITCVLTAASVHDSQVAIPLASRFASLAGANETLVATMIATRVTNLYDLMDSAYHVPEIAQHSPSLGHVPIIDINPHRMPGLKQELAQEAKRQRLVASRFASLAGQRFDMFGACRRDARGANETLAGHRMAEDVRYGERSTAERVNDGLKDNHGGRNVAVRSPEKVMCHLMFGVLSFTVLQLLRLVS